MFRIDKSYVDHMNTNKSFIVINHTENVLENSLTEEADKEDALAKRSADKERISRIEAQEKAKAIIQQAQANAAEIKKSAWTEGYNQGMEAAKQKMAVFLQAKTEEIKAALQEMEKYKGTLCGELHDNVLQLSLDIAEKIVNVALKRDDTIYVGIVEKAIASIKDARRFVLRVSQKEYDQYFKSDEKWLRDAAKCDAFEVLCDPYMEEGDFVVESDEGIINAGLHPQLNKIKRLLDGEE